jgi:ribosomal protein L37AE/L43A
MLIIPESTREQGGCDLICDCGEKVVLALHWDFAENTCPKCGRQYAVRTKDNIWNCCCGPDNTSLYPPDGRSKAERPTDEELKKLIEAVNKDQEMINKTIEQLKAIKAENLPSILKRFKAGSVLCKHLRWMGQNEIVAAFYEVEKDDEINPRY